MTVEQDLHARAAGKCELCGATDELQVYEIPPDSDGGADQSVLLCGICLGQINKLDSVDANHWRCLNDSMWSQVPAVQVMAWRMLDGLRGEGWPQELLDILYLDDETLAWARKGAVQQDEDVVKHLDANGVQLAAGDTVVLVKDLKVKGANFTAKQGTAVRGISLVHDNPEHIEGRVEGQRIVILTRFVKKTG